MKSATKRKCRQYNDSVTNIIKSLIIIISINKTSHSCHHYISSPIFIINTVTNRPDVGDDFGYFGNQHLFTSNISKMSWHLNSVTKIHKSSPTFSHRHHDVINIAVNNRPDIVTHLFQLANITDISISSTL